MLLQWNIPRNLCDPTLCDVLPLHPHAHAAQGQHQEHPEGQDVGDGRSQAQGEYNEAMANKEHTLHELHNLKEIWEIVKQIKYVVN